MSLDDVKLAERRPPFSEGQILTIISVERVKTQQRLFDGVRVVASDENGDTFAEMLWVRETVGPTSKLGAFITKLGTNIYDWIGKKIVIKRWRPKDREIEVITEKKKGETTEKKKGEATEKR